MSDFEAEARAIVDEIDRAHGFDQWRSSAVDNVRRCIATALRAAHASGAEAMREAVLQIGPTNDDLIAVGKALFQHTSMTHLSSAELGAAAFDASLRLAGAFKQRIRALSEPSKEGGDV